MAPVTLPLGSLSPGAACLSITPHIKAYQKSNVMEQRIAEQSLKKRPGTHARPLQKSIGCPKESGHPPVESTYLTGHSQAEPALQLSVQLGTDALAALLLSFGRLVAQQ